MFQFPSSKNRITDTSQLFSVLIYFSTKLLDNKFIKKIFPSHRKLSAFIFYLPENKKIFSHITLIHCGVLQFNTCHISRISSHSPPLAIKLEVKIRKLFFISYSMLAFLWIVHCHHRHVLMSSTVGILEVGNSS